MKNNDVLPWIDAAATLVALIARSLGESVEEVSKRVLKKCNEAGLKPEDNTDSVAEEIEKYLP